MSDVTSVENQLECMCLEKLILERTPLDEAADSLEGQAKAQARYHIRQAKIQAIDEQLHKLRNQLASHYKDDKK